MITGVFRFLNSALQPPAALRICSPSSAPGASHAARGVPRLPPAPGPTAQELSLSRAGLQVEASSPASANAEQKAKPETEPRRWQLASPSLSHGRGAVCTTRAGCLPPPQSLLHQGGGGGGAAARGGGAAAAAALLQPERGMSDFFFVCRCDLSLFG